MSLQLPPGVPLSKIPSGKPPPGVQPFTGVYTSRVNADYGIGISLIILAFFFVVGRVFLNTTNKSRGFGWDDATSLLGWLFATGLTALRIHITKFNRHGWDIPLSWYDATYFKESFAGVMLLCPSLFLTKTVFFFLYLRIFGPNRYIKWTLYAGIFLCFAFFIALPIPLYVLWCAPNPSNGPYWDLQMSAACDNTLFLAPLQGTVNVAIDLFIIIIPIPIVINLSMSRRRKVLLICVFMTGILALAASIAGLAYRVKLWIHRDDDEVYYVFYTIIFANIECFVSLICAAMPAFASVSLRKLAALPGFSSLQSFSKSTLNLESRRRTTTVKGSTMKGFDLKHPSDSDDSDLDEEPNMFDDETVPAHLTGRGHFEMHKSMAQENGYVDEEKGLAGATYEQV